MTAKGIHQKNRLFLERLHREVVTPFTVSAVSNAFQISLPDTRHLLRQLAASGWLSRVRRGLYTTVPLGATQPALWKEDPWRTASVVFAPSYIGGWSACEHWKLTEQLFRTVVVMSGKPLRETEIEIQGTPFRLKHCPPRSHFGTRVVWRDQMKVNVSDPSRTMIDILDDPSLGGGIAHVINVFSEYFSSPHRDVQLLIQYGDRLGNRAVFKRLGFIVEHLGISCPTLIRECLKRVSKGLSMLDPSVPIVDHSIANASATAGARVRITKRWGLRINVQLLPQSHT